MEAKKEQTRKKSKEQKRWKRCVCESIFLEDQVKEDFEDRGVVNYGFLGNPCSGVH